MKTNKKGFTLIELLVVIAIIGILSGVVLTSLNSARNKAKSARIQTSVSQMRTLAEVNYNGSNYDAVFSVNTTGSANGNGVLSSNTQAQQLVTDVNGQGGVIFVRTANTSGSIMDWAIYGKHSVDTNYFCIDSTGKTNPSTAIGALSYGSTCP